MNTRTTFLSVLSAAALATAVSGQDEGLDLDDLFEDEFEEEATASIHDPLEGINRAIFNFNDGAYKHVVKPFSTTYTNVVPDPVEQGISNVFYNVKFPSRFVSNVLQGRLGNAGKETGQFLINSTAGIGGIFKLSDDIEELTTSEEDLGQAFGSWGVKHGFYVVIPFMGPSSLRDFVSDFGEDAVNPIPKPNTLIDDSTERMALRALNIINELPALMDLYDTMQRSSIDPYAAVRDAYAQRRAQQIEE